MGTVDDMKKDMGKHFDRIHDSIYKIKELCDGMGKNETVMESLVDMDITFLKAMRRIRLMYGVPYMGR